MVNQKILAIIPARGGSKRIPKKNIIDINGKPMIAWTIDAALKSKYITDVIVSTDDEEIAAISKKFGAQVPFLRKDFADDISPVSKATIDCLIKYSELQQKPDIVVQLMANCPNRNELDIDNALSSFLSKNREFQLSCFEYGWSNPWWAHKMDEDGVANPLFDESIRMMRSQDQEKLFCPTGAIWVAKTESLLESGTFYGTDYTFENMSWASAVDIDDYEDLKMAKVLMS